MYITYHFVTLDLSCGYHRYTYVPVTYVPANSDRGVDIPTRAGAGRKAASPPVQCIKTLFCFVVPERN